MSNKAKSARFVFDNGHVVNWELTEKRERFRPIYEVKVFLKNDKKTSASWETAANPSTTSSLRLIRLTKNIN